MDFPRNEEVLVCHPSLLRLLMQLLYHLVPIAFVRAMLLIIFANTLAVAPGLLNVITWGYRAICLVLILETTRRYFNEVLILGHTRVLHLNGVFSWQCTRVSIRYSDVRELHVTQSIVGRFLAYGDLSVGTAAKDQYEIIFPALPFPHHLSQLIDDLRRVPDREMAETKIHSEIILPSLTPKKEILPPSSTPDTNPSHAID